MLRWRAAVAPFRRSARTRDYRFPHRTLQLGGTMTRRTTTEILLIGTVGLVAMMLLVAQATPTTNAGFRDAANALAFTTGTAIGIERSIELMWTILGGILGTYWPLTTVR